MTPQRKNASQPLEAINIASAREKSIDHGHPSTHPVTRVFSRLNSGR